MSGTFIHPLTCGFARGIAWQIAAQVDADENQKCEEKLDNETRNVYQARLMREMYDRFSNTFKSCKENFPLDLKRFAKHFPNLRVKFSRWNHRKIAERNQFTATFNIQTWNELSPAMKIEHTFQDCKSCQLKYSDTQALFPVKSHRYTGSMKENNPILQTRQLSSNYLTNHATPTPLSVKRARLQSRCTTKLTPFLKRQLAILL